MSRIQSLAVMAIAVLAVASLAACSPATPEERVEQLRSRFQARVNGFYVEAEPQIAEVVPEEVDEGAAAEVGEEEGAGEEAEEVEMTVQEVTMVQNAHLDLIVQHDNDDMLPGLTVEIFMVGAGQQEKGRWRLWVDTSTLRKANQLQFVHVLEDIPYVEGDGFAAEVRSPIPPGEYGDYEEFANLGG